MARWAFGLGLLAAWAAAACGSSQQSQMTSPTGMPTAAALTAVSPGEGAVGVASSSPITLHFSGAMASGMEQFMDLHRGDLSGGTVPMGCTWSGDRETVACTPLSPLLSHTTYAIHVGGGMMGANGTMVDYSHGQAIGGQWIMGGMMSGTHGGMGWGMMSGDWRNPNGSYGMVFTFTTA
jgi:hypothetical protein